MTSSALLLKSNLWVGLFVCLCLWTGCSSPKLARITSTQLNTQATTNYSAEETAPQAAQSKEAIAADAFSVDEPVLTASTESATPADVARNAETTLALSSQHPQLSRKVAKLMDKVQNQPLTDTNEQASPQKQAAEQKFAKKLLAKAEKKFDIMKAKQGNAAQANSTLIGLGALLAIVGLVLVLATSGTAATIGVVSLVVGVVLLVLSLITN